MRKLFKAKAAPEPDNEQQDDAPTVNAAPEAGAEIAVAYNSINRPKSASTTALSHGKGGAYAADEQVKQAQEPVADDPKEAKEPAEDPFSDEHEAPAPDDHENPFADPEPSA